MTKYAKLNEDGTLEYAPINLNGVSNWINDENAVIAAGYLPLEELEPPEGQYVSGHKIFENKIVPVFSVYPDPSYIEQRMSEYPSFGDQRASLSESIFEMLKILIRNRSSFGLSNNPPTWS